VRKTLALNQICLDFQPPENLIEPVVQVYMARIRRGEKIAPIVVCFDGKRYLLKNGYHRVEAARRLARRSISAEVTKGTLAEMEAEFQRMLQAVKDDLAREAAEKAFLG
jgi:hypothetical protein